VRRGAQRHTPQQRRDDEIMIQSDHELAIALSKSLETSRPPKVIPGYKFERKLGQGAYGAVWLAQESNTGKKVAVKFFHHRPGINWAQLSREVDRLARLYTSRHIVNVLDVGWEHDPPYFIMEYLEAGSLEELLTNGPLPIYQVIKLGREIALGLFHAHQSGVLHCDLKPANILLDAKHEPRICDFGQSRLTTEKGVALGTIFYMAPEQASEDAVPDTRWDVYAYGVILYQMLTGKLPYQKAKADNLSTPRSTISQQLQKYREHVFESEVPREHRRIAQTDEYLSKVIDGCLKRNPRERIPNMQVVLDQLEARENWYQRRPIIKLAMGVLLGLVAVLVPLAISAGNSTIKESEKQLIRSTVNGDSITATILATSMQRDLEDRIRESQNLAASPDLIRVLEEEADMPAGTKVQCNSLVDYWKEISDERRELTKRQTETSWFITDHKGEQIYRNPVGETLGKNFAHRDYFHGQRIEYDRKQIPAGIKPIERPYISLAFKSDQTHRYMVAISVPIYDRNHNQVIGVLGRTIHLWQLLAEWEDVIFSKLKSANSPAEVPHRFLALVDSRDGRILSHPLMTSENLEKLSSENWDSLHLNADIINQMHKHQQENTAYTFAIEDYHDPVAVLLPEKYNSTSIAVFSRIGSTGWYAIVQEQRDITLKPVIQVKELLIRNGIIGISLAGIFLLSFWWWIQYLFKHQKKEKYMTMLKL
jgi:serine/threonine protein kinase